MIISKLQGGLGNQIFQWAYGKSLSLMNDVDLFLDINFYRNQIGVTNRNFELNKFPNLKYSIYENKNENIIKLYDNFIYKKISLNKNNNYFLDGYWQSQKYFESSLNEIKNILTPTKEKKEELIKKIGPNSVSMHIRRTDYIRSNGFHPIQPIEYYDTALKTIKNYDQIIVFSDDINWCKENLNYNNMIFIEGQDNIDDLWLMSLCQHNIIVNSSFSWWGAWLNNNNDKIVISPKKWFGDNSNLNYSDIIPNNWIKI